MSLYSYGNSTPAPYDPFPHCGVTENKADEAFLGNMLIIVAQVITAVQMCIEEKFVGGYNIPALQAVGWEGFFGFITISFVLVGMNFIPDSTKPTCFFEDSEDAFIQLTNNYIIALAILGNVLSIAFFNFFGISVTKSLSASHRMVLDSVRTFVIWGFSLLVGWETFHELQLVGFTILLAGTALYNEILRLPGFVYETTNPADERLIDARGCCGMFKLSYILVEAEVDPYAEPELNDPYNLLGEVKTPTRSQSRSIHRSFATVDELRGSITGNILTASGLSNAGRGDSFLASGQQGLATTPKSATGSFLGMQR